MMDYTSEKQYLRSKMLWFIIGFIFCVDIIVIIYLSTVLPQWWIGLLILMPTILVGIIFYMTWMQVSFNRYEISIQVFPFIKRKIPWQDIVQITVTDLSSLSMGGVGIKVKPAYTAYMFGGKAGIGLTLKNTRMLYFTIKNPEEFLKYVEKHVKNGI